MGTLYFRVVTNPSQPFTAEGMTRWLDTLPDPIMEPTNAPNDPNPEPSPVLPYDDQLRDELSS